MTSLLLFSLLLGAPASPEPQPRVALLVLDTKDPGAVARVETILRLMPEIRFLTEAEFPAERHAALRTTLQTVAEYPDPLVRAVIEKQRLSLKLDRWVILTSRGLFVQDAGEQPQGPYPVPGPRGQGLSESFLGLVQKPISPPPRPAAVVTPPFYRNWLFWTGVGVIVGGLAAMSLLSRDPGEVEVHVFH